MISGLDFCFWTNFLTKNYDEPRNRSLLWPHLLPTVFPGAPAGTPRHILEKKFTRIRDLRNRLAHHEAIWKFQEEDPVTGAPDYNRPVYGLQASLQLLRRAWEDMLEALSWLSPARHGAFLAEPFQCLGYAGWIAEFYRVPAADEWPQYPAQQRSEETVAWTRTTKNHPTDQSLPDCSHYWPGFYPDMIVVAMNYSRTRRQISLSSCCGRLAASARINSGGK